MIIKCTGELNTLVAKSSHTMSSISNVHSITTKLVLHFSMHEIEASISNVHYIITKLNLHHENIVIFHQIAFRHEIEVKGQKIVSDILKN